MQRVREIMRGTHSEGRGSESKKGRKSELCYRLNGRKKTTKTMTTDRQNVLMALGLMMRASALIWLALFAFMALCGLPVLVMLLVGAPVLVISHVMIVASGFYNGSAFESNEF